MTIRSILCYGDSNLRGTIPGPALDAAGFVKPRYGKEGRWTGILQNLLGSRYHIIEEGIGGRTTTLDDIIRNRPYRNGLKDLPFSLETHYPLDLVIFWVGTNDIQKAYNRSVIEIGEGMRKLIQTVHQSNKGPDMRPPKVLVIAPQPIVNIAELDMQFQGEAIEKSKRIAEVYQRIVQEEKCAGFLDSAHYVQSSLIDGIHLDENSCQIIGEAISQEVKKIFV